jgi:hypothetical protein
MKRFVRARILLEEPNTGCVASFDEDSLCVILCRFSKAEHSMLLPLWHPNLSAQRTFENMVAWHKERFSCTDGQHGPRLSGARLEWAEDRTAWEKASQG